jgi:protein-tyrosine phosphatase
MSKTNVLFLCHTNMCLSPIAEGLLRTICAKRKIDCHIESAGFEAYHINESPDKRALAKSHDLGIDISKKRVRLFSRDDFDHFDLIYVMDTLSNRNALYFARDDDDKSKIDFLMNLINPGKNESIPDCFFSKLDASDETFHLLEKACKLIADKISRN